MDNLVHTLLVFCLARIYLHSEAVEYCHNEVFKADCEHGHVILVTEAHYGRMELNRCVKTDFGYVGCSQNVTQLAASRCSGRKSCEIDIPSAMFDDTRPCNEDLKSYLEISYSCVAVESPRENCIQGEPYRLMSNHGYIPNFMAVESGCGSLASPIILQVLPGQRMNISLFDFTPTKVNHEEDFHLEGCYKYADIQEEAFRRRIAICGGQTGYRHIYTSMGDVVELFLYSGQQFSFLIEFKAVGCPNIELPENTWSRFKGDSMVVGCTKNEYKWELKCHGTSWEGSVGNCTVEEKAAINTEQDEEKKNRVSFGSSLIIVLGVSLGIGLCVLFVGLLCLQKFKSSRHGPHSHIRNVPLKDLHHLTDDMPYERTVIYAGNKGFDTHSFPYQAPRKAKTSEHADENEYEYVWDVSSPSNTNTSSLQTPEMGSPISKPHCVQKPDLVQMKTFKDDSTVLRNTTLEKCPIHNTYPVDTDTLNHSKEKPRRLPSDIPPPPNLVPLPEGVELHSQPSGVTRTIVHTSPQCLAQSASFPGGERQGTIRYVQSGTLTKGQIPQLEPVQEQCV